MRRLRILQAVLPMAAAVLVALPWVTETSAQPAKTGPRFQPKFKVGDEAPDFDLVRFDAVKEDGSESTEAKDRIKLSSFRGKQPVFVIFSSYT